MTKVSESSDDSTFASLNFLVSTSKIGQTHGFSLLYTLEWALCYKCPARAHPSNPPPPPTTLATIWSADLRATRVISARLGPADHRPLRIPWTEEGESWSDARGREIVDRLVGERANWRIPGVNTRKLLYFGNRLLLNRHRFGTFCAYLIKFDITKSNLQGPKQAKPMC